MMIIDFYGIKLREDGFIWIDEKLGWHKGKETRDISGNLLYIVAYKDEKSRKWTSVSRLMCHAFLGLDLADSKSFALHKNRRTKIECNNSISNLYIGTASDNMKDKVKDGTCHFSNSSKCNTNKNNEYIRLSESAPVNLKLKDGEVYFRKHQDKDIFNEYFDKISNADFRKIQILLHSSDKYGRICYGDNIQQVCRVKMDLSILIGGCYKQVTRVVNRLMENNIIRELKDEDDIVLTINPVLSPNGVILTESYISIWEDVLLDNSTIK